MRSSRLLILGCFLVVGHTSVAISQGLAQQDVPIMLQGKHVPDQVLVRFNGQVRAAAIKAAHRAAGHRRTLQSFHILPNLHLVEVRDVERALYAYLNNPAVVNAEPNYIGEFFATPNDTNFGLQWGLNNVGQEIDGVFGDCNADIRAPLAWEEWTGDSDFKIAILDTGVFYDHPDLEDNIWENPDEMAGDANSDGCPGDCNIDDDDDGLTDEDSNGCGSNGMDINGQPCTYLGDLVFDDDENGYIDDIHGYDFVDNDGDPLPDMQLLSDHGTVIAGIIAAVTDNDYGIAGVNWEADIVALRTGSGVILASDVIAGVQYVEQNSIRLANGSWGLPMESTMLATCIGEASDTLFIFAAGSAPGGNDIDQTLNVYPQVNDLDNVIVVAGTTNLDEIWSSSNYGPISVDLGAPGLRIYSTRDCGLNCFGFLNGTSFAAPHVTGVAALLMTRFPQLSIQQVRDQILQTVRPIAALRGITVTEGVVDAYAAISDCTLDGLPDSDGDGVSNVTDNCPCDSNSGQLDTDGDGVGQACDNCQYISNRDQNDCDTNGFGDACQCDVTDPDACEDHCPGTQDICMTEVGETIGQCRHFGSCP